MVNDKIKKTYRLNDRGRIIGEGHPRLKLTDDQVEKIRDLHEEGMMGYRALAKHFGVHRDTVAKICQYNRRIDSVATFKTVYLKAKAEDKVQT